MVYPRLNLFAAAVVQAVVVEVGRGQHQVQLIGEEVKEKVHYALQITLHEVAVYLLRLLDF